MKQVRKRSLIEIRLIELPDSWGVALVLLWGLLGFRITYLDMEPAEITQQEEGNGCLGILFSVRFLFWEVDFGVNIWGKGLIA